MIFTATVAFSRNQQLHCIQFPACPSTWGNILRAIHLCQFQTWYDVHTCCQIFLQKAVGQCLGHFHARNSDINNNSSSGMGLIGCSCSCHCAVCPWWWPISTNSCLSIKPACCKRFCCYWDWCHYWCKSCTSKKLFFDNKRVKKGSVCNLNLNGQ